MFFLHSDFLLLIIRNGIFDSSEYPKAAGTPESGTGTTISALAGHSLS